MSYRKGRRLEYVVRDMFRRRGWLVIRAAGSKPVDLVCLKGKKAVLVECKYGRGATWRDLYPLLDAASRARVKPVLAVAEKRGKVTLMNINTWSEFRP